jgi:hypothetical protein
MAGSMESFVERSEVRVLRVLADWNGGGPAEAMARLESHLPTLRGRKFYGVFRLLPAGEEYFACVEQHSTDEPAKMGVETGVIPGGLYVRRKLAEWEKVIAAGKLGTHFQELHQLYRADPDRPEVEFYRSMAEMHLLMPVLGREMIARGQVAGPVTRPPRTDP